MVQLPIAEPQEPVASQVPPPVPINISSEYEMGSEAYAGADYSNISSEIAEVDDNSSDVHELSRMRSDRAAAAGTQPAVGSAAKGHGPE